MNSFADIIDFEDPNQHHVIAISDSEHAISYRELSKRSKNLALYLQSKGIRKSDRVAIFTNKCSALIVSIFGIMKSGACYVPIDYNSPQNRLKLLIEDISPNLIITSEQNSKTNEFILELGIPTITTNEVWNLASQPAARLPEINANDLAYIIYTSGSSGAPKGVKISHGNVVSYFESIQDVFPIKSQDQCLNTLSYHFDGSIVDTFFPLYKGATLHILKNPPFPDLVLEALETLKITHFTITFSTLDLLLSKYVDINDYDLSKLEYIMTGAEACKKRTVNKILELYPHLKIINGYGPTEATCDCLTHTISIPDYDYSHEYYPIGMPLSGMKAKIIPTETLSAQENPYGELVVSGAQVSPGYHNNENETKDRFYTIDGERYYKTGDLVMQISENNFQYMGRIDDEIKLNGYRINLNEIKNVILKVEKIQAVELIFTENANQEKYIGALIQTHLNRESLTKTLEVIWNKALNNLPKYMLPKVYVFTRTLPQTSSQKIDKQKISSIFKDIERLKNSKYYIYNEDDHVEALNI